MDKQIQQLIAEQAIGDEAEKFLRTPVGAYVDGCSQQEIEQAKDDLLEIDPFIFETLAALQSAIAKIQTRAKVAQSLRQYLEEAIVNGNQATHQLSEDNDGES